MLLLVVYRSIPRLDALPGGRNDSRILVFTFTCSLLLGIPRFFDLIVNGSLCAKGSHYTAHRFSGVRVIDSSFFTQNSFPLTPALVLAVGPGIGMHTLHDDASLRQGSAAFTAVASIGRRSSKRAKRPRPIPQGRRVTRGYTRRATEIDVLHLTGPLTTISTTRGGDQNADHHHLVNKGALAERASAVPAAVDPGVSGHGVTT